MDISADALRSRVLIHVVTTSFASQLGFWTADCYVQC